MNCLRCNNELQQGAAFCSCCGAAVQQVEEVKKISMKCEKCGGTLTVDSDKMVLTCPYCDHKTLIIENDAVAVEKIRATAYKEIELEKKRSNDRRQQMLNEAALKYQTEYEIKKFKEGPMFVFLVVTFAVSVVFSLLYFVTGNVLAGILSIMQAVCFATSWCMGMQIIKGKKRYLHVLIAIVGIMLAFPTMKACSGGQIVEDTDWNVIVLGDVIPEPASKKIKIHYNTGEELWIDVLKTSDEDYYGYIALCKEYGYTIEMDESSYGFCAYNEDGYEVELSHYGSSGKMTISVDAPTTVSELEWEKHTISSVLPEPKSGVGSYVEETEEQTKVIIGNMSKEDYAEYVELCIAGGFEIDAEKKTNSYESYDSEGNKVTISHESGPREMTITLNYPMEFSRIIWPTVGVATLLPLPESLSGKVTYNQGWSYSVYLENTTREKYEIYVQKCIEAGFTKDISNYGDSVRVHYSDDIELNVSYEGFNIMYIKVSGDSSEDYSSLTRKMSDAELYKGEYDVVEESGVKGSDKVTVTPEPIPEPETPVKTPQTSETKIETTKSEYEKAFMRKLTSYTLYIMFDEDTQKVVSFGTHDTYVMCGLYSGNFSNGVTISWDDGWNEYFTHSSGSNATLIDGNGFDWDYKVCDVGTAQSVLDDLK